MKIRVLFVYLFIIFLLFLHIIGFLALWVFQSMEGIGSAISGFETVCFIFDFLYGFWVFENFYYLFDKNQ